MFLWPLGFLAGFFCALSFPRFSSAAFSLLRRCPGVSRLLRSQISQEVRSIQASLRERDAAQDSELGDRRSALSARGWSGAEIDAALDGLAASEKVRWAGGRISGAVYCQDEAHRALVSRAFARFAYSNPLHSGLFPAVRKMEAELVRMTAEFVGGDNSEEISGLVTSGGTESIFTAVLAHRNLLGEKVKGAGPESPRPQVVALPSAHPALAKACHYLGLDLTLAEVGEGEWGDPAATAEAFRRAITPRTILLYVSAPAYPHGEIDPVGEVAELARSRGIGCHVDACLGGFVLPWMRRLERRGKTNSSRQEKTNSSNLTDSNDRGAEREPQAHDRGAEREPQAHDRGAEREPQAHDRAPEIPAFDFSASPGVSSMSLDTHKYGLAPKGTSLVLFRGEDLKKACSFATASWSGGVYASPSLAGSRPGGLIAAAWASLMALGEEGLARQAAELIETRRKVVEAVERIPSLEIIGKPLATVVAFKARETLSGPSLDVYRLAEALRERGWHLSPLQFPPALHFCLCAPQVGQEEDFAEDLAWAAGEIEASPEKYRGGMCASYGLAGDERVPRQLVEEIAIGAVAVE